MPYQTTSIINEICLTFYFFLQDHSTQSPKQNSDYEIDLSMNSSKVKQYMICLAATSLNDYFFFYIILNDFLFCATA